MDILLNKKILKKIIMLYYAEMYDINISKVTFLKKICELPLLVSHNTKESYSVTVTALITGNVKLKNDLLPFHTEIPIRDAFPIVEWYYNNNYEKVKIKEIKEITSMLFSTRPSFKGLNLSVDENIQFVKKR